ncbi:CHAT domain-containing protein [Desulfobacterales bacterium HSG16]|nr:CHAT domain-containing protein [Desulfobacterales bacterium HSG16]
MMSILKKSSIAGFITFLQFIILIIPEFAVLTSANATHPKGISTDGSLGQKMNLPGPNYEIRAELGKQAGANLFHSFQQFNIHSDESAAFSGPDSVQNIISRVTGGDASWIDGLIHSEISGADLYLLNPAGFMFGPNASLDLSGSFHVSTADYLRMGENGHFYSNPLENEILSVSPPTAFGFLSDNPAPISFEGGEIEAPDDEKQAGIRVSEGKTISVIGGNITINGEVSYERPKTDENGETVSETAVDENGSPVPIMETVKPPNIHAEYGRVNMAAAASTGEVVPTSSGLNASSVKKKGDITISNKAEISVSGEENKNGPDSIFIRAGQFTVSDSDINANNYGENDADKIDIQADKVTLTDGTTVYANTYGTGKGADIIIQADETVMLSDWNEKNETRMRTDVWGEGDAGNVLIEAKNIIFKNGTYITQTLRDGSSGNAASITLKADDSLSFSGLDRYSQLGVLIQMTNKGSGEGGNIIMEADTIFLTDNAWANGTTYKKGKASDITVRAREITGNTVFFGAGTSGRSDDARDGGNILIEADNINFSTANIITNSNGKGNAGDITLKALEKISFSNRLQMESYSNYEDKNAGDAGNILIEAEYISFKDKLLVRSGTEGKGDAGTLKILAGKHLSFSGEEVRLNVGSTETLPNINGSTVTLESGGDIRIDGGAEISTESMGEGAAGDVHIRASRTVTISGEGSQGKPSRIYAGSTGTTDQAGSGGNIFISADTLILSDKGAIQTTSAGQGKAGSIELRVRELRMDSGSSISSGSESLNIYSFDNITDRDNSVLLNGDLVKVEDTGNGKSLFYINTGNLVALKLYKVENLSELDELKSKYSLQKGDLAELTDANGERTFFTYYYVSDYGGAVDVSYLGNGWIKFDSSQPDAVMENMSELLKYKHYQFFDDEHAPPFEHGDVIRVEDAGNGRPATYLFRISYHMPVFSNSVDLLRVAHFDVADIQALNQLPDQISIQNEDVAKVADAGGGVEANFMYQNGNWIKFNNTLTVADEAEMNNLVFARPGYVADVADTGSGKPGTFISTGTNLLPLDDVHITETTSQLDNLFAQDGDVVYVTNADGAGNPASFVWSGGQWTEFFKGDGDNILIKADTVTLTNNSAITSSTQGHGDASNISMEVKHLNIDSRASISSGSNSEIFGGSTGDITIDGNMITLKNGGSLTTEATDAAGGDITLSVKDRLDFDSGTITTKVYGGNGKGGNIEIRDSTFVIMNPGEITADAKQGAGGNIHMTIDHLIQSRDSAITASSELGIDGEINIESAKTDVSSSLTTLPSQPLDASQWIATPCEQRTSEDISRFVIAPRDGLPLSFDDLLAIGSERLSVNGEQYRLFTENGDFAGLIRLLENEKINPENAAALSSAYMTLGHYKNAVRVFNTALPLAENSEDTIEKALFYSGFGDLHLILGDIENAITYTKKALKLARQADNSLITASILNNLGNLRTKGRNYSGALKAYREASDLTDNFGLKSKVLINNARTQLAMEEYQDAAETIKNVAEQIKKQPDTFDKAANLISLNLAARKIPNHLKISEITENREEWLAQAARIGEKIENQRLLSCAYGYLGQCHEEQQRYADALKTTRKAIFFAEQGDFPEILYRWQWQMGRLLKQENDIEQAVLFYQKAIATLNPIRTEFFTGFREHKQSFKEDVKPVYLGLAQLLMEQPEIRTNVSENPEFLVQAGDTMEMLKKAELQDFYRDECLETGKTGETREQIPSETAVIYPISLPDYLSLLLIFPDGMKQIKVPVTSKKLEEIAKRLRESLESWEEDYLDDAGQLYDWLIRPAQAEFISRKAKTLIIVPDGVLSLIPFAALHNGERFLIEEYALGTVPSLSLTDTRQTGQQEKSRILLNGLSEARQGFAPLKNVRNELQNIGAVADSEILLNQDFTTGNIETEMQSQDYDIVHMATHAVFGDKPEDTFLLTYDDRLTLDGLDRLVGLKKYQEKQLDLLTLSACETAVGNERAAFGLAGVAIRAGARSALATLWKVDDNATAQIIEEFYRQYMTTDISKAEALQNAQKKLIGQEQFEHPIYWAPFLLIGNWR